MRSRLRTPEELNKILQIRSSLPNDLEGLIEKLSDQDPDVRGQAAISMMSLDDQRAIEPLIMALNDDSPNVRTPAAMALGHYRAEQALPALLDRLANDPSDYVRPCIANALGRISGDIAMEALKEALKDQADAVRHAACWRFAHNDDRRAVDEILNLLEDPEWSVRKAACEVLIKLGVADRRIVDALERLRQEPEGIEYEKSIVKMHEFMQSEEYKRINAEAEEAINDCSREEKFSQEELDELFDKPFQDLADRARKLLESRTDDE